jgi:hypothetical protein
MYADNELKPEYSINATSNKQNVNHWIIQNAKIGLSEKHGISEV